MASLLEEVKRAMRVKSNNADLEGDLLSLIKAAQLDLHIAGVIDSNDALVKRAIITYVKMHTGNPPDYDHLKASYDEQKAQLMVATGYTQWQ
jgi:hypothetical protein